MTWDDYYAWGSSLLLFTHTFMNIGMTISVTPITGLPLCEKTLLQLEAPPKTGLSPVLVE